MKKLLVSVILLFVLSSLSAQIKGFSAKIFDENNTNFMNLAFDYNNSKAKIITNEFVQDYRILHIVTTVDKSTLYIGVLQAQLYNNGNFDSSKEETLIFNLKKSTFSTNISKKEFKCEFYSFKPF